MWTSSRGVKGFLRSIQAEGVLFPNLTPTNLITCTYCPHEKFFFVLYI